MHERIIPKNRNLSQMSSAKLRRARRLYIQLIVKTCIKSKDMIFIYAQRAQTRGLYSPKTGLSDIASSILGHLKRNPNFKKFHCEFRNSYGHPYADYAAIRAFFKQNRGIRPRIRVMG